MSMPAPAEHGDVGEITVNVEAPEWSARLPDAEALARRAVRAALAAACPDLGPAGVAVVLADDRMVRSLNRDWREKDTPTNVLSFPATDTAEGQMPAPALAGMPIELGDVVLGCGTCVAEAAEQQKPLAHHVEHLIVHGVLHLLGYDHVAEDAAVRMERMEARVLATLGVPDPYET